MASFHFDEIIKVVRIDPEVLYDKVSRINAKSEENEFFVELDVHTELYPMHPSEKYRMLISSSLNMDASSEGAPKSLADKFEYVMHGCLYKMTLAEEKNDKKNDVKEKNNKNDDVKEKNDKNNDVKEKNDENDDVKVEVYISFGGLQLMLRGDPMKMHKFAVDQRLFLLLRKI